MPVSLASSGGGSVTLAPPSTASAFTQTLVPVTATLAPLVSATAQASTSGTSIDFTGIPSWVKRITVMFRGVSTNGTSNLLVQIGSGSIETSGYTSASNSRSGETASTAGFIVTNVLAATDVSDGACYISAFGSANNYVSTGIVTSSTTPRVAVSAGGKTASGVIDRLRITTVNGTDTFDAGSINIMYEG